MEIAMLDSQHKYRLPQGLNSNNVTETFKHQATGSFPFNFNVFISNIFDLNVMWPLNTTGLDLVPRRHSVGMKNLNGSSAFNMSDPANVNLSSILEMFSTLRPLDQLANDDTYSGQFNNPQTPGNESFLVTLIWSLLFYPMVVLAMAGNLMIIWIIATKPLMRTVMNRFLLNLSLSDFLSVSIFAI